ncbi:MAG: hypothetical protein ACTSRU_02050 [Candidatus Hodarchaeales archaeon]
MSIVVHDIEKTYQVRMFHEESQVDFHFRQLTYAEKSEIVQKTTSHNQGIVLQDVCLSDYLSAQIALVKVEGLSKRIENKNPEEGGESHFEEVPYELEFENGRVTDKCMNEIFNTPFEDRLIFTAKHLKEGIPNKITHPFTGEEIEGVEVVYPSGGMPKKL